MNLSLRPYLVNYADVLAAIGSKSLPIYDRVFESTADIASGSQLTVVQAFLDGRLNDTRLTESYLAGFELLCATFGQLAESCQGKLEGISPEWLETEGEEILDTLHNSDDLGVEFPGNDCAFYLAQDSIADELQSFKEVDLSPLPVAAREGLEELIRWLEEARIKQKDLVILLG